ncbi:MAG TPA: thiamine phosphate synthase [Verrucomicrobiae bacterium]|nr:thiamine phosphate synthase [Verrucomicrobiae bacterium]
MTLPSPLYVILDGQASGGRRLDELLDAVLAGGCRLVQLREKTMPPAGLFPLAQALRRRCREAGALFIVNDRVDLALAVEADGAHVGQDDLPAREARRLLPPPMILGVSTHNADQARRARDDGADYVAVGSMFPTGSKIGFELVGPELVRRMRADIPVPLVAIGGITRDNLSQVIEAGADAVAVISAIGNARDPAAAVREFLETIRSARGGAR